MKRTELVALLDEIIAILESEGTAVEKVSRIEAAVFEPGAADRDNDAYAEEGEDEE
jgi:hypothetical protein